MRPTLPLRGRVTLAFAAMGFVLSGLFAAAAVYITEDYEHVLAAEMLHGQADDYALRLANGLPASLPQTHRLSGYSRDAPAQYAALPPGIHEDPTAEGIHVGVFDTAAGRLFFVIDLADIEQLEYHLDRLLAAIVVFGTLLSGALGGWLAKRALAPLSGLAAAVDGLPVEPVESDLAASASPDELGRLARAIDGYQARLVSADVAQRQFFADASHELRTPIAVVQGAAELLQEDATELPVLRPRLDRLDRGVAELTELLEALLRLGRRHLQPQQSVDAAAWLRQLLVPLLHRHASGVAVDIAGAPGAIAWHLAPHDAGLVLRSLIRGLVPADAYGKLEVGIQPGACTLEFLPQAGVMPRAAADDRMPGGTLIRRLAAVYGWTLVPATPSEPLMLRWGSPEAAS